MLQKVLTYVHVSLYTQIIISAKTSVDMCTDKSMASFGTREQYERVGVRSTSKYIHVRIYMYMYKLVVPCGLMWYL